MNSNNDFYISAINMISMISDFTCIAFLSHDVCLFILKIAPKIGN